MSWLVTLLQAQLLAFRIWVTVRLRVIRPLPKQLEGFELSRFELMGAYDVQTPLCDILIVAGYAIPLDPSASARIAAIKAAADAVVTPQIRRIDHHDRSTASDRSADTKRTRVKRR